MSRVLDLLHQARAARNEARRARRLAGTLTQVDDQSRLLRYADGEDLCAVRLEQQAVQQASASMESAMRTVHQKWSNRERDPAGSEIGPLLDGMRTGH